MSPTSYCCSIPHHAVYIMTARVTLLGVGTFELSPSGGTCPLDLTSIPPQYPHRKG